MLLFAHRNSRNPLTHSPLPATASHFVSPRLRHVGGLATYPPRRSDTQEHFSSKMCVGDVPRYHMRAPARVGVGQGVRQNMGW